MKCFLAKWLNCGYDNLQDTVNKNNAAIKQLEDKVKQMSTPSLTGIDKMLTGKFPTANLVYEKRWVFNSNNTYSMDARDFLRPTRMINGANIQGAFRTLYLQYVSDNFESEGIPDFWQLPEETQKLGKGDCEDMAALRAVMARKGGFDVVLALGFLNGNIGHAFNIWKNGDKLYILEPTSNSGSTIEITDITKTVPAGSNTYDIYFVVTPDYCYRIRDGVSFGALV